MGRYGQPEGGHGQVWAGMVSLRGDMVRYGQVWSGMGRYGQPEGGHGQVWSGMGRYGQVWSA